MLNDKTTFQERDMAQSDSPFGPWLVPDNIPSSIICQDYSKACYLTEFRPTAMKLVNNHNSNKTVTHLGRVFVVSAHA
jgi:hypothetical protein